MTVNILFLNNKDVEAMGGCDMRAVIQDVKNSYIAIEKKEAILPGKCVMRWGSTPADENVMGRINAMPGYIGGEYDMAGIKWIGSGPMNYKKGLPRASVTVILNDPDTKLPVCIADGTAVSAKRTGASGGVAMELLSKKDASVMTICGAGAQSRTQLEAALIVRPTIKTVYIYDIVRANAERFATESMAKYEGLKVIVVDSPEEGVRVSDIIITVTLADTPIIKGEWVKKGALMMNMADFEYTYDCVEKADKIFVDNWDTIKHRMISTVALMYKEGLVKDEDIDACLGEVLCGTKPGRESDEETIYFNAVGMGILDLAVITRCYRKAAAEGVGQTVNYWA